MALEKEMETFRRHKDSLLDREGQYVLIQGDQVVGTWPTFDEALTQGYEQFGFAPIMVKKIERVEKPKYLSRNVGSCPSSTAQ